MIAWSGNTRNGTPVGVYLSGFSLPDKAISALSFKAENGAVWMIAAAGLSEEQIPIRRRNMIRKLKRNEEWRAFSYERSIQPDSAIDFSFLNDAPAGKYGFVKAENGEFVFEKTRKPIRFHGGNLTFETCYPTHEEADVMVDRIRRIGYNSVRLHHFDHHYKEGDPQDRLDYLVSVLKKNGIYISLDLYTFRTGWKNLRGKNYKCAVMLLHLTDVQIENSEYLENADSNRLYRSIPLTGTLLARRGTAEISLKLPDDAYRLHALSPDGKRLCEVPFLYRDGELRFHADTFGKENSVIFAYELQRKNP